MTVIKDVGLGFMAIVVVCFAVPWVQELAFHTRLAWRRARMRAAVQAYQTAVKVLEQRTRAYEDATIIYGNDYSAVEAVPDTGFLLAASNKVIGIHSGVRSRRARAA
jgi:hypothetical protein